jgi:hypothetical protein
LLLLLLMLLLLLLGELLLLRGKLLLLRLAVEGLYLLSHQEALVHKLIPKVGANVR